MSKRKTACRYCNTKVPTNELGGWDEYHDCKEGTDLPLGGDMGGMYTDQVMEDTRERLTKGIMDTWKITPKQENLVEKNLRARIERLENSIINACRLADLADSDCCSYHTDAISCLMKEWGHILGDRLKDKRNGR